MIKEGGIINKIVLKLQRDFKDVADLKIKEMKISTFKSIYVVYIETICSSDKINDYILKGLHNYHKSSDLNTNLPGANTVRIEIYDKIEFYLTNGFAVIISGNEVIAIEVKGDLSRSISNSIREPSLFGPEDSFNENYQTNLGLIKRRIKSNTLKTKEIIIGRKTKTNISINYLDDVANLDLVNDVMDKLNNIDVDGVIDVGTIINYLEGENKTIFPTIKRTERPDLVVTSLLEGKIAILTDTSPFALILPTFLVDFINPVSDNYEKSINVGFIKILRELCFLFSIIVPGFFVAIMNYNQETIPSSLLINFSTQSSGVPFPSIIEVIMLLIICDILRESDLRFPSSFGSAISILGALIIGEAAVNAGLVSPIAIIVASFTFITSLIFNDLEINNALRFYRYLFLFFAAFFGLYGIFLSLMIFLIHVISIHSLNSPYFAPIAPFNKDYFYKTVLKKQDKKNTKRSDLTTNKNFTRGRFE